MTCINVTKPLVWQAKPDGEFKTGTKETDTHLYDKDSIEQEWVEAWSISLCCITSPS